MAANGYLRSYLGSPKENVGAQLAGGVRGASAGALSALHPSLATVLLPLLVLVVAVPNEA